MKIVKILLVLVFLAVAAVYTVQDLRSNGSDALEPPVLSCGSELVEISVFDDDSAILAGVTATDAQDGDLTGQVLVSGISNLLTNDTARVTYVVFDSDDNMATLTRQVRYTDYRRPRFSIQEPLIYEAYADIPLLERLRATDTVDGDITGNIRVSYTEATDIRDVYTVDVQVTNSMGDTSALTVPVILLEKDQEPLDVFLDTYLMYLNVGDSFDADEHLERVEFEGLYVSRGNVTVSGEVDTATPGTYMVIYNGVYGSHTGTAVLTVVVE